MVLPAISNNHAHPVGIDKVLLADLDRDVRFALWHLRLLEPLFVVSQKLVEGLRNNRYPNNRPQ
jgi:hypothetical protein